MDNISVDTSPQEQQALMMISVDSGQPGAVPLPDNIAASRTSKAVYGLTYLKKPYEDIQRSIQGGDEDVLRAEASSSKNAILSQRVNDAIYQLASSRNAPLTTDEINGIRNNVYSNDDFTSPHNVIE